MAVSVLTLLSAHQQHWTDYRNSLSVCQSVSLSVCHTKRAERSTDRNPSLSFTKLATKVESRQMWLSIVLVEIRNTHVRQSGSGINFLPLFLWKNSFNVKYL